MAKLFRVINQRFQLDIYDAAEALGLEDEEIYKFGLLDICGFLGKWPNFSAIVIKKEKCSDYWIIQMRDLEVVYIDTDDRATHIGVYMNFSYIGKDKRMIRELAAYPK
jgi:hypothetical protein